MLLLRWLASMAVMLRTDGTLRFGLAFFYKRFAPDGAMPFYQPIVPLERGTAFSSDRDAWLVEKY